MRRSSRITGHALIASVLIIALLIYAASREDRHGLLTVSFLDIGQGDSIFIDAPSGRQVLVDGGKGSLVLQRLSSVMPWWDRSIDVVIATHPDADHIGGLIDVLSRYTVGTIVHSSVQGDTQTAAALEASMRKEGAAEATALRGQVIALGGGAYIEILFPDRAVPHVETNDGSIVARLVYGDTVFMLTGDAPATVENYLAALDPASLHAGVLKAGHHGSKYSSGPIFLGTVGPQFGIFSRGCDNTYGHPAPDVVERFASFGIPTFDTCTEGTITFVSDGTAVTRK
jgi:competence protein ComEC